MTKLGRRVRTVGSSVLFLSGVVACSSEPAPVVTGSQREAIIGGQADTTHRAVVAVFMETGACSGTMVKTDPATGVGWVLTAAHCIDGGNDAVFVRAADDYSIGLGSGIPSEDDYPVLDNVVHPSYVPSTQSVAAQMDFAMLRVAGVDTNTPTIPVLPGNLDNMVVGSTILEVGYGKTAAGPDTSPTGANSLRRSVTKTLNNSTAISVGTSGSGGGSCFGDSGGPSLYTSSGTQYVGGVHSYVINECSTGSVSGRVTSASAASFIAAELAKGPPQSKCDVCQAVAQSAKHACHDAYAGCLNDHDCASFVDCQSKCKSATCRQACRDEFPLGVGPALSWNDCACLGECKTSCGSVTVCGSIPKCSFDLPTDDCGKCLQSSCCEEVTIANHDPVGNRCLDSKGAFTGCDKDASYKAVERCRELKCSAACAAPAPPAEEEPPTEVTPASETPAATPPPAEESSGGCNVAPDASNRSANGVIAGLLTALVLGSRRRTQRRR